MQLLFDTQIKTTLSPHGSFGGAVEARYECCDEPVCFVTFAECGDDFIITTFGFHPSLPPKEVQRAGDYINAVLKQEAHRLGIKRLLFVHPSCDTAEVIDTYEIQPFVVEQINCPTPSHYIN
jgi:hypothetical protein